jgi:EAL domain-containing protein (putative c-di-GMP-specific phosphodiesterase class I)
MLRTLGCELVQGYLFSPPLTPVAVRSLFQVRG